MMHLHIFKMNTSNRAWLFIVLILLLSFVGPFSAQRIDDDDDKDGSVAEEEIHVGVILDMGSWEGKTLQTCISMAISDFYTIHDYYKTRVVLHTRDSKGEPLLALSSALELLQNSQVRAIFGAQTSMEAKFLAELGDKTEVPIITFSPSSSKHYPYFLQISQNETCQAEATAAIVAAFGWRDVIIVHEDSDDWTDFLPHLVNSLQGKSINVAYKTSFTSSFKDDAIIEELYELKKFQQTIFIVHMSPSLTTRIFENAKELGMMGRGYAWIMTVNSMNHLNSIRIFSHVSDSMHGVIGLRSYIPASEELRDFTSRWRKIKFHAEQDMEAYNMEKPVDSKLNLIIDLDKIATTSRHGTYSILLKEILQLKFKGLSGEFQFVNGKLVSNAFEIVNMLGRGERRVGFWTFAGKISREPYSSDHGRQLSSSDGNLEDIIWPGGYATIPKGYMAQTGRRKLRIAVPGTGFTELVNIDRDLDNNVTTITGFCIDVFKAAIRALPYEVDYEFIPFLNSSGENIGNYNELIYQIYLQNYDGAVGDITITANRTLYVDFTLPYSDLGVGMIVPKETTNNLWIFLEPLKADLWLSSAGLFVMTGFVVWLIERPINNEFQGSISQQIGTIFWFSFSTLTFTHKERLLSNLSRFVVTIWVFVVLILTSSYTATLTSMITVQHIKLNSKENYIGYHEDSFTKGVISNLNFKNSYLQPFSSPKEYADALSRGSKKGGVSAIIDEIPYIKIFLAKYSADYSMVGSMSTTNGFAFAFRKGSPLALDMSRVIAQLRGNRTLSMIENEWFKCPLAFTSDEPSTNVKPLTIDSFRGLFLITGVSSALALAMLSICLIHKNWHVLKNCNSRVLFRVRLNFVKEYLSKKLSSRNGETSVIHPEQITP
ncbi:hypothetical protein JRO89_XS15G0120300 [Xanthoceras sorbifolium]|uniref:Glutamate receptor n=1 Tax=Xanthoceras sorbifolium TaxID=99658 RepID=A0ABQ8H1S8_9ROSI|nr:hypothetical protein JRO89_XS15G0120300 [Xanthoceras sorbifolium]